MHLLYLKFRPRKKHTLTTGTLLPNTLIPARPEPSKTDPGHVEVPWYIISCRQVYLGVIIIPRDYVVVRCVLAYQSHVGSWGEF